MYLWLAIAHSNNGSTMEAIKILNLMLDIYHNFEDALLFRGKLYVKVKRTKEAIKDYELVLKNNQKSSIAYVELGKC